MHVDSSGMHSSVCDFDILYNCIPNNDYIDYIDYVVTLLDIIFMFLIIYFKGTIFIQTFKTCTFTIGFDFRCFSILGTVNTYYLRECRPRQWQVGVDIVFVHEKLE